MTSVPSGSKRWTHFHSALQLAIQRSTHKWTYEDFTECFSLWCEEQPEASATLFNTVAQHMESNITNRCEDLLTQFNVKENVDKLHAVVTDARARKQVDDDYDGKDLWKEDLPPRAAVRAKTVPLLQQERDRLKAELEELDQENQRLQAMMQANIDAQNAADEQTTALLDLLDEACKRWNDLPMEEIESWRLATAESITPSIPK
ncbi:hypothetical protein QCA50_009831 [Cerrena zonata]|uniref:Uncharacterized protein n=1 Tax=Cerrena zonata TaxID=2478898 RepID=A0AAW0GE81_9APHY